TALVWDYKKILPKPPAEVKLPVKRLEQLRRDLWSDDAQKGYLAMRTLARSPGQAVELLSKAPRPAGPAGKLEGWIRELDSEDVEVRENATEELGRSAELAEAALRRAFAGSLPAEARRRVKRLLDRLPAAGPHPSTLATVRSLELLEMIATPEARRCI